MKKLVIILSLAILGLSVALVIFITKFKPEPVANSEFKKKFTFPANGLTLNGVPCNGVKSLANMWVNHFVNDNVSDETKTAIWVRREWLDNIATFLKQEHISMGADGIRIYFAKDPLSAHGEANKIIITATQNGKIDYFVHNASFTAFLKKVQGNTSWYFTEDHGGHDVGAYFYNDGHVCVANDCSETPDNNINCDTAHNWVKHFRDQTRNPQGVNTDSETFTYDFIEGLDQELTSSGTTADGFRIYFAKSRTTHKHLFIIVPTQKNPNNPNSHLDNYSCFAAGHEKGPNDNGEQCPDNCTGVTLPQQ